MHNNFETLSIEVRGQITYLHLNRPEQHNALNRTMIQEITRFFRQIREDDQVRIVVIRGTGKSFCSGADILWMKNSISLTEAENQLDSLELAEMFGALSDCRQVVIGMAHGNIFGGGNGLLAACDLAYCTNDSRFSLSETRIGLVAASIAPHLLKRIAPATVKEMLFTARRFDGIAAEKSGLVNRSFATITEMEAYVESIASDILKGGPLSVENSKKLMNQLSGYLFPEEIHREMARLLATTRVSPEAQEGMQAFLEKRNPNWIK
jgi:methylglutaconyl-CoA hydratase